jgi:hypothetical protein
MNISQLAWSLSAQDGHSDAPGMQSDSGAEQYESAVLLARRLGRIRVYYLDVDARWMRRQQLERRSPKQK